MIKRVVTDPGGKSRVLCLSGTPIDKQEHATVMFRALHVMQCDALATYNPGLKTTDPKGIYDITQKDARKRAHLAKME